MKGEYQGIFRRDVLLLRSFTVFMWIVMLYVFFSVFDATPGMNAKVIISIVALVLVAFATCAIVAVYKHLKCNGSHLYEEEMTSRVAGQ